jgi:hypothetical protein
MTIKSRFSEDNVQITVGNSRTDYYFIDSGAYIKVSDIQDKGRIVDAEFNIEYPVEISFYSNVRIKLYDRNDRKQLARDLKDKCTSDIALDWDSMLDYVIADITRAIRQPPEVINIDDEPENKAVEYTLEPILIKGQSNSIFCPGGFGKTTLADSFCVQLTHNVASPAGFVPGTGERITCLYADYEGDAETHKRYVSAIEEGLGLTEHLAIPYISCYKPFFQYVELIRELVERYNIELLVVDSIMAATAGYPTGMNEAQIASSFFNDLRSIGITSLGLDHATKADMREGGNNSTPYGSIVKYNRCRNLWEIKMDESFVDSEHREFSLFHKKHNLTQKHPAIGVSVDYINKGDILESITFSHLDIADNAELSKKSLTKKQRAVNAIKAMGGSATIKEVAEYLEEPDNEKSIGVMLSKNKKDFVKIKEGTYGLVFLSNK